MPEHVLSTLHRVRVTHILACLPWLMVLAWLGSVAWFLTDDAFISFRYARNLLEGHGLVFNPGEYVEGYTNFLWILELAAIWGLFGVRPEHTAPFLSVAYTIGSIIAMLWWVLLMPSLRNRALVGWMALGLLCSSATFAVWTSGGGLETRQFTFFVVMAVVCLGVHGNNRWGLLAASLSLAAAALTRPEGVMLAACCFGWFGVQRVLAVGRLNRRAMLLLVGPFAALVAAHFLFRYGYYGEWLPNTYYAKHVRPWYESGFRYLWAAGLETGLYLLLPLAFVSLWERWRTYRDGTYALVLLCVTVHMAYLLRIGGDYFEYRPLDFYWPLLAVPAAQGLAHLGSRMTDGLRRVRRFASYTWLAGPRAGAIVLFLPVLFYTSAIQGVLLFEGSPRPLGRHLELDEENMGWLLAAPGMSALIAISNDLRRQLARQMVGLRFPNHRDHAKGEIQRFKPYEKMERGIIPDDALMAQGALGILPYYLPHLKFIDIGGLADVTVARNPVTPPNHRRMMAHDRHPPPGYLKQRGVNFHIYPPAFSETEALDRADYTVKVGPALWMPFDAQDPRWVARRFATRALRVGKTFSTNAPASNQFHVGPFNYVGERFLGNFEEGFDGWRLDGEAITNHGQRAHYEGEWWMTQSNPGPGFLTSYHPSKGDEATGRVWSPEFTARADQHLAFLIAGGAGAGVGLRLLADGVEAAVWRGKGWLHHWKFSLVVHSLVDVAGKTLQLELFDNESGSKDLVLIPHYIMLDHVMLVRADLAALDKFLTAAGAPLIHSSFDVYLHDRELIYVKDRCRQADRDALFSLHWAPTDKAHLPAYWKEYGFNVRDFRFADQGVKAGDRCVAIVRLPEYAISQIKTGQFVYGKDKELVWRWRDSGRLDQ